MEKNDEQTKGSYDYGARIYDSRICKWLSIDPLFAEYNDLSPYHLSGLNPILNVDVDGRKFIASNLGADDFFRANLNRNFGNTIIRILTASGESIEEDGGTYEYDKVNRVSLFFATLFVSRETRQKAKAYAKTINSKHVLELEGKSSFGATDRIIDRNFQSVEAVAFVEVDTKMRVGMINLIMNVGNMNGDVSDTDAKNAEFEAFFVSSDNISITHLQAESAIAARLRSRTSESIPEQRDRKIREGLKSEGSTSSSVYTKK
jgi:RHS repeat-associated protein